MGSGRHARVSGAVHCAETCSGTTGVASECESFQLESKTESPLRELFGSCAVGDAKIAEHRFRRPSQEVVNTCCIATVKMRKLARRANST